MLCRGWTWFDKEYKVERVYASMFEAEHRFLWDNVNQVEYSNTKSSHPNVKLVYQLSKKVLTFNQKEYFCKQVSFRHNNAIYCYSTSNGNAKNDFAAKPKV